MDQGVVNTVQAGFAAITFYNSFELVFTMLSTFRSYRSLYFWSIVACAFGNVLFTIGFTLYFICYFDPPWLGLIPGALGWFCEVNGFAFVMYSRLSMIRVPQKTVLYIRYMIIINFVLLCIPCTIFGYVGNIITTEAAQWYINAFAISEKIHVVGFCLQEFILSGFYLYYIRTVTSFLPKEKQNEVVHHTLYANAIVLVLDFTTVIIEYCNLYEYQIYFKAMIYTIKLKFEFYILNYLASIFAKQEKVDSMKSEQVVKSSVAAKSENARMIP